MIRFKGMQLSGALAAGLPEVFKSKQRRLDEAVIRTMAPYVPVAEEKYRNHGRMSRSHVIERPGVIINTEPRARREYYTNAGHGNGGLHAVRGTVGVRGRLWFERMKADHKRELREVAEK